MLLLISGNEINDFELKLNGISLQRLNSALLTNISKLCKIILNEENNSINILSTEINDSMIVIRLFNL